MINEATVGGGQRHLLSLAGGLDKKVFEVFVACAENGPLVQELRCRGIPVLPVSLGRKVNVQAFFQLCHVLQRHRIDVIHVHGGVAGWWGRLSAAWVRTPVRVYTLHGIHYLHYRNRLKRATFIAIERALMHWTDCIICVAQSDREAGLRAKVLSPKRSIVIRNGIEFPSLNDTFSSEAKKRELGIPLEAPLIGTVGRLHHQKGQRYLLEAVQEVLRRIPELHVLLVGDGPMRGELEALTRRLGLNGRVHFLGFRRDVAELVALLDVFILPSVWEGMPLSLLEALALARPVVATAADGVLEVVEDGRTGLLVPPRDPGALAGAITELLSNRDHARQLGLQGQKKVYAEFGVEKMVQRTAEVYLELITNLTHPELPLQRFNGRHKALKR